jgi:hypothetical protein
MSIYRKFDRSSPNDVHAKPLKRELPSSEDAGSSQRRHAPSDEPLPQTMAWAAKLPRDIQPVALLRRFPRIANFIAAAWAEPEPLRRYFDEIFVDLRGNRKGFPPEVMEELFALRAHHEDEYPTTGVRWADAKKRS